MKKSYKIIIYILLFLVAVFLGKDNIQAEEEVNLKRVLFISSYNAGFDTLPRQLHGVMEVFENTDVIVDVEYMDTKVHNSEPQYENYFQFLKGRLGDHNEYDVVIVGDDNALQFLMDRRLELFPDTPIVFFCVNNLERAKEADAMDMITGVIEGISANDNLELAMELFPDAKNCIGIVDNTNTGIGDALVFMEAGTAFENVNFELLNISEYSFEESEKIISEIDSKDVIFYLSMFRDKEGKTITIDQAIKKLVKNAKAPIFRMSIGGIGKGILGGKMVSYEEQGKLAAEMAESIINGEDPNKIKMISDSPNKYFFDYKIMKHFGLSEKDVPKDSIILNKPSNFFKDNKTIILPTLAIMSVMALFILLLVYDNRRLKNRDEQLIVNNDELSVMYEEIASTEEKLRSQYDQILISQKKLNESEERYKKLAYTDTLTSLNNRIALMRFLDQIVKDDSKEWYLIYMDLDNFKYINDSRGHEIGDLVLIEISKRLRLLQEQVIYLSRLGGDEFVIIVDQDGFDVDIFIRKFMKSLEKGIHIGSATFYMTASLGVTCFPEDGCDKNVLLRKADMAMYYAKVQGKGRYSSFSQHMELAAVEKLMIQSRIGNALDKDEFELFYQPQYDYRIGKMTRTEVLIRWKDSNGTYISPGAFIPISEEQGSIQQIGAWVYEDAAKRAKKWDQTHDTSLFYSVNVSGVEIVDENFATKFLEILKKYEVDCKQVAVEITENVFIDSQGKALTQLQMLRDSGIEIHLDDFGSGYSSLNYLLNFPLDVLKIDMQYIKDITGNVKYKDMVAFIINISHRFGLKVIAEGVETKEQFELLQVMNCDSIQGYYYGKPMPFDSLNDFFIQEID